MLGAVTCAGSARGCGSYDAVGHGAGTRPVRCRRSRRGDAGHREPRGRDVGRGHVDAHRMGAADADALVAVVGADVRVIARDGQASRDVGERHLVALDEETVGPLPGARVEMDLCLAQQVGDVVEVVGVVVEVGTVLAPRLERGPVDQPGVDRGERTAAGVQQSLGEGAQRDRLAGGLEHGLRRVGARGGSEGDETELRVAYDDRDHGHPPRARDLERDVLQDGVAARPHPGLERLGEPHPARGLAGVPPQLDRVALDDLLERRELGMVAVAAGCQAGIGDEVGDRLADPRADQVVDVDQRGGHQGRPAGHQIRARHPAHAEVGGERLEREPRVGVLLRGVEAQGRRVDRRSAGAGELVPARALDGGRHEVAAVALHRLAESRSRGLRGVGVRRARRDAVGAPWPVVTDVRDRGGDQVERVGPLRRVGVALGLGHDAGAGVHQEVPPR